MNTPEEIEVLKLVCHRLDLANIPYMLTGSFAANFYVVPRMTRDIDIVIEIPRLGVDKFLQVFQQDFYIDKTSIHDAIEHQGMFNIIHNNSIFKTDFIIRKDSDYRQTEFERRRLVELQGTPIWIVSPEDLIISKLFWAKDSLSQIQLKDIKSLLLSLKDLDKKYVDHWVQKLQLNSLYEKVSDA